MENYAHLKLTEYLRHGQACIYFDPSVLNSNVKYPFFGIL